MISVLEIKNFKSIRHLKLNCKRINVFIGQPNTGKSNILESLGLMSFRYYSQYVGNNAKEFVRFERTGNLFYDEVLDTPVQISWDANELSISFQDGRFRGIYKDAETQHASFDGDHNNLQAGGPRIGKLAPVKFYRFADQEQYGLPESDSLLPPSGDNLVSVLLSQKQLRSLANELFSPFGLRLGIRPQEGKLEVIKEYEDIIVSYPYQVISETLRRLIFYLAAILSNKESVLIFEEPESHAFPYYTKYLAELIALDENQNQYFISTHNPYFLLPIVEKSLKDDLAVFIIYIEDYETKVKPLGEADLQRVTELDIFSNLNHFLDDR